MGSGEAKPQACSVGSRWPSWHWKQGQSGLPWPWDKASGFQLALYFRLDRQPSLEADVAGEACDHCPHSRRAQVPVGGPLPSESCLVKGCRGRTPEAWSTMWAQVHDGEMSILGPSAMMAGPLPGQLLCLDTCTRGSQRPCSWCGTQMQLPVPAPLPALAGAFCCHQIGQLY